MNLFQLGGSLRQSQTKRRRGLFRTLEKSDRYPVLLSQRHHKFWNSPQPHTSDGVQPETERQGLGGNVGAGGPGSLQKSGKARIASGFLDDVPQSPFGNDLFINKTSTRLLALVKRMRWKHTVIRWQRHQDCWKHLPAWLNLPTAALVSMAYQGWRHT